MKPIQRVTIAGLTAFALLTPTAFAATSQQVIETNHGWVSYHSEAKLSSPVLGRLELGQKAPLVKKANAYWYEIDVNGRNAFITTNTNYTHVANVTTSTSAATPAPSTSSNTTSGDLVVVSNCYLKSAPNLNPAARLGLLSKGTTMTLLGKYNSYWYHVSVDGKTGYITTASKYVQAVSGQEKTSVSAPATTPRPATSAAAAPSSTPASSQDVIHVTAGNGVPETINLTNDTPQQQKLIQTALTQLGVPYWWGHQVPNYAPVNGRDGFDCSNFVAWTYRTALGIDFSGSSIYQRFHVGAPVTIDSTDKAKYLQPGDLLFFANASQPNGQGHVGIYIGNGLIIQEGGGRGKVTVESLNNSKAWFGRSLVFARRVLN